MIEDIKGYKPHTDDKISKVNAIKDAEVRLGLIFDALYDEFWEALDNCEDCEFAKNYSESLDQLAIAKTKLKEASMWACRAVFQPEEKY
ncbi:Phage protein [Yersinia phage fPS-65]|uniref:Phage protein n=1 Tax=Yersinia phage fPS-65 TaxID=2052931 RepID=A0A449C4S3_9CAUD|nr:Phage protein [Yersinia phage fPS-65]VEV89357.1 Phage protein [Yersinia phage fPS-65]